MKFLRQKPIMLRLILIYFVLCLIPILALTVYFRQFYSRSITQKIGKTSTSSMSLLDDLVRVELDNFEYLTDAIIGNHKIQQLLTDKTEDFDNEERQQLSSEMNRLSAISELVTGMYIFDSGGNEVFHKGYYSFSENQIQEQMQKTRLLSPMNYFEGEISASGDDQLLMWNEIYSLTSYNDKIGYLALIINEDVLAAKCCSDIDEGKEGKLFFCRDDGMLLSSRTEKYEIGTCIEPKFMEQIKEYSCQKEPYFQTSYQKEDYLVTSQYNAVSGWYEVLMTSEREIEGEIANMNQNIFRISLLWVGVSIFALFIIERTIIRPIRQLYSYAKDVEAGKDISISDNSRDEIGYLSRQVNSTIEKVRELQRQEAENNRKRREQELNLLQAQIRPHFLFNILNTFRWMAVINGVPALEKGLECLAKFLRSNIMGTQETVSIAEESETVRSYVYIQSLLYGNKINLTISIDSGLEDLQIPKLLLQPVIENSILHGIREHGETLNLGVKVSRNLSDSVRIQISDDGKGFQQDDVQNEYPVKEERETLEKKKVNHIGMANVRERILLYYGEAGRLLIESKCGEGTRVTMILPVRGKNNV